MGRQNSFVVAAIVVLALAVIVLARQPLEKWWHLQQFRVSRTRPIASSYDGEEYRVHLSHARPDVAADHLAYLHEQSINLMEHLRGRYVRSPKGEEYPQRRAIVQRLLARYNPDQISESSPNNPEGDTSYILNKGELFALCLREKNPGGIGASDSHDIHDTETLWFVTVHELAHLGTVQTGHPPEFWECFKFFLYECIDAGLAPNGAWPDYQVYPIWYCGLQVDYNPLYDDGVPLPM